MVLRGALGVTAAGLVVGTLGAWAAAQTVRALLFGVTAGDPRTFAAIMALLIALALIAAYRPARSAASVDPMSVLRE
jgi:ABC-type antimicrobial peptide transport system permease subunit